MLTGQTAAPRRPSTFLYSKVPPPNHHLQCRFPRPALWSITPICMSCLVYPWLSMQVSFLLVHFVCRCLGRRRAPRYRRHELKGSNWRQVPRRQGQARPPRVTWKRSELGAVTTSDWTLVSLGLGSRSRSGSPLVHLTLWALGADELEDGRKDRRRDSSARKTPLPMQVLDVGKR